MLIRKFYENNLGGYLDDSLCSLVDLNNLFVYSFFFFFFFSINIKLINKLFLKRAERWSGQWDDSIVLLFS